MKILKKTQSDVALAIEPDARMSSFQKSSFQENIKFFIIIGQCFGLMPLEGITNKNVRELKFTWKSWKFLYCMYNISGAFVTMIFCCIKFTMYGLTIDELGNDSFCFLRTMLYLISCSSVYVLRVELLRRCTNDPNMSQLDPLVEGVVHCGDVHEELQFYF